MNGFIILIDGRRAAVQNLIVAATQMSSKADVWIISSAPLFSSADVKAWIAESELDLIVAQSNRSAILFLKEIREFSDLRDVILRDQLYFEGYFDEARRWSKLAYLPQYFLSQLSRLELLNFFEGFVPKAITRFFQSGKSQMPLNYPNVLFVCHTDLKDGIGGVQLHVNGLIQALRTRQLVYFLCFHPSGFLIRSYDSHHESQEVVRFDWGDLNELSNPRANSAFQAIIQKNEISIVHFHHLQNLCWSLVEIAKMQTKTYLSLHDYHAFCRRYDLIGPDGAFCNFCAKESNCKAASPGHDYAIDSAQVSSSERRAFIRNVISGIEILVPSLNQKMSLVKHLGLKPNELKVLEIPSPSSLEPVRLNNEKMHNEELVVGFVGLFSKKKGAFLFAKLVTMLSIEFPKVKWKVFGDIVEFALADQLTSLYGVEFLGPYQHENIRSLIKKQNVRIGLVLSIWPETFSLTLSEILDSNCLAIVTNLGAPADRIAKLGCGWTVSIENLISETKEIFKLLEAFPALIEQKRALIPSNPYSILIKEYYALYNPTVMAKFPTDLVLPSSPYSDQQL